MGIKRWLVNTTIPCARSVNTIKNIVEERSVVEGVKKSIKQEFCEDNPVTTPIYNVGKYDGKIEGYVEASDEYEKKLLEQADLFLQQKKDYEKEREEYELLLDAYDKKICELQNASEDTQDRTHILQQLLLKERELKNISVSSTSASSIDEKPSGDVENINKTNNSPDSGIVNGFRVRTYNT